MYLDDRTWFCSRHPTCLQIAKAWKTEADRLGLDESQNKAEFAVVSSSPAIARKDLTEALQAGNLPEWVVIRPKILGSRSILRNESGSVKEETDGPNLFPNAFTDSHSTKGKKSCLPKVRPSALLNPCHAETYYFHLAGYENNPDSSHQVRK